MQTSVSLKWKPNLPHVHQEGFTCMLQNDGLSLVAFVINLDDAKMKHTVSIVLLCTLWILRQAASFNAIFRHWKTDIPMLSNSFLAVAWAILIIIPPAFMPMGIYSFRLSIRPLVCLFVRPSIRHVRGIYVKVFLESSQVGYISPTTHQKASIFGLRVPWKVCFHAIGSCHRVGSRTPLKSFFYFSIMETNYTDVVGQT